MAGVGRFDSRRLNLQIISRSRSGRGVGSSSINWIDVPAAHEVWQGSLACIEMKTLQEIAILMILN